MCVVEALVGARLSPLPNGSALALHMRLLCCCLATRLPAQGTISSQTACLPLP